MCMIGGFTLSVGNTALTYACCGGYEDVVVILLEARADVEHQNENGHTPLMEAASCGHVGESVCASSVSLMPSRFSPGKAWL